MTTKYFGHTTTEANADLDSLWAAKQAVLGLAITSADNGGVNDARAQLATDDAVAAAVKELLAAKTGTYRVGSALSLAAAYRPIGGAVLKPDNGVTVTLNGDVAAGKYQIFDVSNGGKVQLGLGSVTRIYPEWFGGDPTNTNDSTAALQAAIDTAIASNVVLGASVTIVLSGRYKTTNSLRGFSWAAGAFSFCTFALEGAKGYIGGRQVEICPTFTDRPALILQAARAVEIRGISFTGALPLVNPTGLQCLKDTGGSGGTPWYNSGNVGRDTKYSPSCAIAIDPFSNGVPSDGGYPGHNGVAGSTNYYTQNIGSSNITIERCIVRQFIVAYGVGLSNGSQQCDDITFRDCNVENVKVFIAVGQTQSRNVNVVNSFGLFVRTMFDCRTYGVGNGQFPNVMGGAVAGACKWLMIAGNAFGVGTIKQFYGESLWSLGQWQGGSFGITFDDCHFALNPTGSGGNASSHLDSGGPVIFRGGFLGFFNNVYSRLSINCTALTFDGCMLSGEPMVSRYAPVRFMRATLKWSGLGGTYGIDHEFREYFLVNNPNAVAIMGSNACVHESFNSTDYRRLRWREYENTLALDAAAVITVVGDGTATFTSATAAPKLQVGELIATQVPTANWVRERFVSTDADVQMGNISIGAVQSIVGNLVTLQDVPNGFGSGTYNIALRRLPQFKPRTVGIATAGSNVMASVSPAPTMWRVGDRIQGTNVPAGTYVTAVSTGGATITMSQNATGSGTSELYDVKMVVEEACAVAKPTYEVWFAGDVVKNIGGTKDGNNMIPAEWRYTTSGRGDGVAPAAVAETIFESTVTPAT